ncbi:tetratricopeptide repeat protein [Aureimonas altamirensis]|uniref:tetratricopeptide repeat protein n=1 Tax=Aureimonas altamirensis TaxID=370622 RepID=UPI002037329D|nr:tetratricopeptide repeat protein [Aureimonas altamirensis]MCM2503210.1 tetratricopeptide repeat protein [Aureimonas altamirensis]
MRFFFALLPIVLLAAPASAQTVAPSPEIEAIAPDALLPPPASVPGVSRTDQRTLSRDERLDALFHDLRREGNRARAERIARQIQSVWNDSGSATVNLLLTWSEQAISDNKLPVAFDLVEQGAELQPDNPEIWNRRAMLNYRSGNFGRAIVDVTQVLTREPRHYPALMGLGAMLEETGRNEQAMEAYQRALDVYPTLKDAQDAMARLADQMAGQRA